MKSLLVICVIAAVAGVGLGAVLGYYDARPWAFKLNDVYRTTEDEQADAIAPQAKIDQQVFAFGNMERGTLQRHTFPIENQGTASLKVVFLTNTCKCTAVELNGSVVESGGSIEISPGESGEVTLEWEAKQEPGPFRHGANFQTNDPELANFVLEVEGEIVDSATLSPASIYFGNVQAGDPAEASIYVMSFVEQTVEVLSHEIDADAELTERIEIEVAAVDKSELPDERAVSGVKITAKLQTIGSIGSLRGALRLTTNLSRAQQLVVPISANVRGDITIFGDGFDRDKGLLILNGVKSSVGAKSQLMVNVRGDQVSATTLEATRVDPPELKVTVGQRRELTDSLVNFPLTVEVPEGTRPMIRVGEDDELGGDGEGEIVLSSNHPTTPEVRIRVRLVVTP